MPLRPLIADRAMHMPRRSVRAAPASDPSRARRPSAAASAAGCIPTWRDNFYPAGLVQRRELEYASRQLRAIEINSTYYRAQSPATYAKWAGADAGRASCSR